MEKDPEVRVHDAPNRCPYCKDLLADPKQVVACAACGARHHADCHAELGACATCGATQVLVPRDPHARSREQPPRGSKIEVVRLPSGAVHYSWPGLGQQELLLWVILGICIPCLFPLLLLALLRRNKRAGLLLRPDGLELDTVTVLNTKHVEAVREDIGAVRLERVGQQGYLRLSVDVGVDRLNLGGMGSSALKEPEREWLFEVLQAWKEEA